MYIGLSATDASVVSDCVAVADKTQVHRVEMNPITLMIFALVCVTAEEKAPGKAVWLVLWIRLHMMHAKRCIWPSRVSRKFRESPGNAVIPPPDAGRKVFIAFLTAKRNSTFANEVM